jgi:pyruvate-formate lyase
MYHLVCWKESSDRPEVPVGRLDQILYPYYEMDKKAGKITPQDAAELLGALWLKIRECENLVTIPREQRAAPGSLLPNITLCGTDKNGNDLTNEVSWLVLEAMAQVKLSEPAIYVRYNPDMDPEFILHALRCNRDFGGGNPAFLNDKLGTQRYLDRGVPIETELGTLYGIDPQSQSGTMQQALHQDLTPAGAAALLVFFAFAMQCTSTLAVVRRETNSWKWPVLQFSYMTALAYVAAFATNHIVLYFLR